MILTKVPAPNKSLSSMEMSVFNVSYLPSLTLTKTNADTAKMDKNSIHLIGNA